MTLLGDERAKPSHQPCAASQPKGPSCSRWPLDDGGVRARLGVVLARSFVIVTSLTQSTKCHSSGGSAVRAMRASEGRGNDMTFLRRNDMTFHAYRFACMRIRTRPLAVPSLPPLGLSIRLFACSKSELGEYRPQRNAHLVTCGSYVCRHHARGVMPQGSQAHVRCPAARTHAQGMRIFRSRISHIARTSALSVPPPTCGCAHTRASRHTRCTHAQLGQAPSASDGPGHAPNHVKSCYHHVIKVGLSHPIT